MSTPTEDTTPRLANDFSRIIRDWLTPGEMAEVLRRNKTDESGVCATHDYCDANRAMAEAFSLVTGRACEPATDSDAALWSAAWEIAKKAEFPRTMELIESADGEPVYAFTIKDVCIEDPHVSECGRFTVDPIGQYGLRPEEISALESANSALRAGREMHHRRPRVAQKLVPRGESIVPTISGIRELYPNMQVQQTMGGSFVLRHDCDDGGYLLITKREGTQVPPDDAKQVDVGRCAANGEVVEKTSSVSIEKLEEWIDAALDRARDPQNVADYFAKTLGASHRDHNLRRLRIDSPCGRECVKAIDAAVALVVHVRVAFGNTDGIWSESRQDWLPTRESDAIDIARQVVSLYWRS